MLAYMVDTTYLEEAVSAPCLIEEWCYREFVGLKGPVSAPL
jgi:hypothetical protein